MLINLCPFPSSTCGEYIIGNGRHAIPHERVDSHGAIIGNGLLSSANCAMVALLPFPMMPAVDDVDDDGAAKVVVVVVVVEVGIVESCGCLVCISNLNSGSTFRTHSDHDVFPHPLFAMLSPTCFSENSPLNDEEAVVEASDSMEEEDDGGSKNISPSSSMYPLENGDDDDDGVVDDVDDEVGRPLEDTDAVVGLI